MACALSESELTANYPNCTVSFPSWIGDGMCDDYEPYNTEKCGDDGGDCVKHWYYPDCTVSFPSWIGDGMCDDYEPYNTEKCGYDGGDCIDSSAGIGDVMSGDYPSCGDVEDYALGSNFTFDTAEYNYLASVGTGSSTFSQVQSDGTYIRLGTFTEIDENVAKFENGSPVWCPDDIPRSAQIQFVEDCNATKLTVIGLTEPSMCYYELTISGTCSCTTMATATTSSIATTVSASPIPVVCVDAPAYLDMYGGTCAEYELPGNENWCGGYGNDGEAGMTPNENCCICIEALSNQAKMEAEEADAATEIESSTPSPSVATNFGANFGFGSSLGPTEEPCLEEAAALEACMPMDDDSPCLGCALESMDNAEEALGSDVFNFLLHFDLNDYCTKMDPCINQKCPTECHTLLYDYQKCNSMGIIDCDIGSASSPSAAVVPSTATQSPVSVGSIFGSSPGPTDEEPCLEEAAAVEACIDTIDLANFDSYLECSMCSLTASMTAMGDDDNFFSFAQSFDKDEYCGKFTSCVMGNCTEECQLPMHEYHKCSMGIDCGIGRSGDNVTTEDAQGESLGNMALDDGNMTLDDQVDDLVLEVEDLPAQLEEKSAAHKKHFVFAVGILVLSSALLSSFSGV